MNAIADVQSSPDLRNMPINQVGIKDLRFPIANYERRGHTAHRRPLIDDGIFARRPKRHAYVALCGADGAAKRAIELRPLKNAHRRNGAAARFAFGQNQRVVSLFPPKICARVGHQIAARL